MIRANPVISSLLILCLLAPSSESWAMPCVLRHDLSTENLMVRLQTEALSAAELDFTRPSLAGKMTRRGWATALALLGTSVIGRGQIQELAIPGLDRPITKLPGEERPLYLPFAPMAEADIPQPIKDMISKTNEKIEHFQNERFFIKKSFWPWAEPRFVVNTSMESPYPQEALRLITSIRNDLMNAAISFLSTRHMKPPVPPEELKAYLSDRESEQNHRWAMIVFLPQFFAMYGYKFETDLPYYRGIRIPVLEIRPLLRRQFRTFSVRVISSGPVQVDEIVLGKSLVRTLHDFLPSMFGLQKSMSAREGTQQIFIYEDYLAKSNQESYENVSQMFEQYPKLLKEIALTANDEPDPLKRSGIQIVARSILNLLGGPQKTITKERFAAIVTPLMNESTEIHEAIHIAQFLAEGIVRQLRHAFFAEANAFTGQIAQGSAATFMVGTIMSQASTVTADQLEADHHAKAFIFLRNRLLFQLWKDQKLQERIKITFPEVSNPESRRQFRDLPLDVQLAVLEHAPDVDEIGWQQLGQTVFDELQKPEKENPFLQNLDTGVLQYSFQPKSKRSVSTLGWISMAMTAVLLAVTWRWYRYQLAAANLRLSQDA